MEKAANFADRLFELIKEDGKTLRQIAEECKMSYSSLSKYQNNSQTPDANSLQSIADYFNVTTDYLLCRTDVRKPDATLQAINEQTGLSEEAIVLLQRCATKKRIISQQGKEMPFDIAVQPLPLETPKLLSAIICNSSFPDLITRIIRIVEITPEELTGILGDSIIQHFKDKLGNKADRTLNYQNEKDIEDLMEYQVIRSFTSIVHDLKPKGEKCNGH